MQCCVADLKISLTGNHDLRTMKTREEVEIDNKILDVKEKHLVLWNGVWNEKNIG